MGEVVPFERPDRAKRLAREIWKWAFWRFHVHHWDDVEHSALSSPGEDGKQRTIGNYILQKCSVPGCGKYRKQSFYI